MFKALRRFWKYLTAKLNADFNERADPKVQLEQAIGEAQEQHRRLKEQAANVIANQKQTELRLNRAMEDLEKLNGNARQAVIMADEATKRGDTAKAAEYTRAAEAIANQLIQRESDIDDLKTLHLQSTQAADQAKHAVEQNSVTLQKKLADRQRLLGQLDQAKMQEQMNRAMSSLSETVGEDVPSLDEVRDKIEARYAKAKGMSELAETGVESRMLEIEQAARNSEAQGRLAEIRAQLGLAPAAGDAEVPSVEQAQPAQAQPEGQPGTGA
jgi:phage shock protein A